MSEVEGLVWLGSGGLHTRATPFDLGFPRNYLT